jgi:hypothetical protein
MNLYMLWDKAAEKATGTNIVDILGGDGQKQ